VHHAFVDELGHVHRHRADARLHLLGTGRRLIERESAIGVGEPLPAAPRAPTASSRSGFCDLDAADRALRPEADGELERPVLAIDAHEHQRTGDLVPDASRHRT